MKNYYQDQLKDIDFFGEYLSKIKIQGNGKSANWLDVNKHSAKAIIEKLQEVVDFYEK